MSSWRTIDSAPKDEAILLYASGFLIAHFNSAYRKWVGYSLDSSDTIRLNGVNKPTHWMPLPSAPPKE